MPSIFRSTTSTRARTGGASIGAALLLTVTAGCAGNDAVTASGVATAGEWCGVAADLERQLDGATPDLTLAAIQPTYSSALVLVDQLIGGLDLIDPAHRADVEELLLAERGISQLIVDAEDDQEMRAGVQASFDAWPAAAWNATTWLEGACASGSAGGAAGGRTEDALSTPAPFGPTGSVPVIVDQSPTVSDVGALLFLAARPDVDLLAVTLPGTGEAECAPGIRTTLAALAAAGRTAVPVGCGRDEPLAGGGPEWPAEWRASANALADIVGAAEAPGPGLDAEELLEQTLRAATAPVTVVILGPLTNVGAVLGEHPELVAQVERVVVMGGAFGVPGNVAEVPEAEWNVVVDATAARAVLDAGVPVSFVPLDATDEVPLTQEFVDAVGALAGPAADLQHRTHESLAGLDFMFLWDEVAAVATLDPAAVAWEERSVIVTDDGVTRDDPAGASVRVAVGADAGLVRATLLDALAR